jgi:hypothetical protein
MKIDFTTGKVYYSGREDMEKIKQSLEEMKIETPTTEEAVFSKTRHQGLPYGRLKYMCYCFLLMMDGLIGLVSFGQTQSILAQKYLLSDCVMGDTDGYR